MIYRRPYLAPNLADLERVKMYRLILKFTLILCDVYQDALVTPGILPCKAKSRKTTRQMPKLRM